MIRWTSPCCPHCGEPGDPGHHWLDQSGVYKGYICLAPGEKLSADPAEVVAPIIAQCNKIIEQCDEMIEGE